MIQIHERAIRLNDLANKYALDMRYTSAIEHYREALALYLHLAKEKPIFYGLHIAHVFSNLSAINLELNKFKRSEELYFNALKMHRALAKHDFEKYGLGLGICLVEGVQYLRQHTVILYEAEMVLSRIKGDYVCDELLDQIDTLRQN